MNLKDLLRLPKYKLWGDIDSDSAGRTAQWLLDYSGDGNLAIILNTTGGSVNSMLGIYDAIQLISDNVYIITMGTCQSAGVTLLTATDRNLRYATPNTRFMTHGVSQSLKGEQITCAPESSLEALMAFDKMTGASSVEIHTLQARMIELMVQGSFLTEEQARELFSREHSFWPETALEYGLIGHILESEPSSSPEP